MKKKLVSLTCGPSFVNSGVCATPKMLKRAVLSASHYTCVRTNSSLFHWGWSVGQLWIRLKGADCSQGGSQWAINFRSQR